MSLGTIKGEFGSDGSSGPGDFSTDCFFRVALADDDASVATAAWRIRSEPNKRRQIRWPGSPGPSFLFIRG